MRWLAPLALVLLAAGLRFYRIDVQSLWYDEGISAFQLTRSFGDIVHAASQDTHPPLYYWTLKAWGDVFGSSELALRGLSAIWGVVAVALTWLIGKRLFGQLEATIAALLLAVAPLAVYYSQEVRMYGQVTALGLLAVYGYTRRWYWLYAVAGIATLYSQYLGAALLAAPNIHALLYMRSRDEWLRWLVANALVILAFLPWLPTFIAQQTHALNTRPRSAGGLVADTLGAYGGGIAHSDLLLWTGAVLVILAVLGYALSRSREATLALLLWLLPLGLVVWLGLRSGLFEVRYLVVGMAGLALLAANGIVHLTRQPVLATAVAGMLVVPAALGLRQQYFDPALARDDYRGLVHTISDNAHATDAVILSAPNQSEVFTYYYRGSLPLIGLPAQRPIDAADTRQRLDEIKHQYDRVWLVDWAMNEADPRGVISGWLAENGFKATHTWYGSVQLSLVGFDSDTAATEQLNVPLDNGIVLEGYRLPSRSLKAGETIALTLVWRAPEGATATPWKVFTHLLDDGPSVVAQRDAEPADNLRPTTSWKMGERIEDNYGILVPDDLPAGDYTLEIGMYNGEHRATFSGKGDHLVL
ncbi:MAG TPA: glycosyltransferase family 39 protein, partial [Chloroflexota bacterium]|nr:glycosyltransferase family 39 protein [Chloroflexota bacterium]